MKPSRYVIPRGVVDKTSAFLAVSAKARIEVVVFWSVIIRGKTVRIESAWLPRQYSGEGLFLVPGDEMFALNKEIYERGERLLAQVHTHPSLAFHSSTDSEFAVTSTEGGLSIVVPEFGAVAVDSVLDCAYFIFDSGSWRRLDAPEAKRCLKFEARACLRLSDEP